MGADDSSSARADDEAASVAELFVPLGDEDADEDEDDAGAPPARAGLRGLTFVAAALALVPALWLLLRAPG